MRVIIILISLVLGACSLTSKQPVPVVKKEVIKQDLCETESTQLLFKEFCSLVHWNDTLIEYASLSWQSKQKMLSELDDDALSKLKKILLTHGNDTPYANRLRAQAWINNVQTVSDRSMTQLLDIVFYQPNQQLLEFESAITILSQLNARQSKTMTAQEAVILDQETSIKKLKQQIQELLSVEASLIQQGQQE